MGLYTREINIIKKDLGLRDWPIEFIWVQKRFVNAPKQWMGTHTFTVAGVSEIAIAVKGWARKDVVEMIAHEMRHAWQRASGTQTWLSDTLLIWNGTQFYPQRRKYDRETTLYKNRPEEIDAYAYEEDAWERLFSKDAIKKPVLTPHGYTASLFY